MQLCYFTDPMCSWCWGFEPVVRQLASESGYPLRIHVGGLYAGATEEIPAERLQQIPQMWRRVADETGQEFATASLPQGFRYNTEPSCRALVTAREIDADDAADFLVVLHRAFYVEGRDITRDEVLQEAYAEFRPQHAEQFSSLFHARIMRAQTMADIEYTRDQLGISAFPTLVLHVGMRMQRISQGYNTLEVVREVLQAAERRLAN